MTFYFHRTGILILFVFLVFLNACQTLPENVGSGDWANVTLRVTGTGKISRQWSIAERIEAIQRAKVDVYAQLEFQIMALETTSGDKLSDLSAKDDSMQKKISAFVRGAEIIRTQNDKEGVKIIAQLFLGENFKATIGLARKKQEQLSNPNARGSSSRR